MRQEVSVQPHETFDAYRLREAPMPFSIRPSRRVQVHCSVTYHAGTLFKLPLAYISGFGS